jgi:hypothetical protein
MTTSLIVGIYAIVKASTYGWTLGAHARLWSRCHLGLLMGCFIIVESRIERPIMPLRILKLRSLTASSVVRGLSVLRDVLGVLLRRLYMEKVLALQPPATGVAFLPITLAMAIMSLGITSRLLMRYGPMRLLVPGMSAVIVGCSCCRAHGDTVELRGVDPAGVPAARRGHEHLGGAVAHHRHG